MPLLVRDVFRGSALSKSFLCHLSRRRAAAAIFAVGKALIVGYFFLHRVSRSQGNFLQPFARRGDMS